MRKICVFCLIFVLWPTLVFSFEVYKKDEVSLSIGFWGQAWDQFVTNAQNDGNAYNEDLNDLEVRRAYFNVKGQATEYLDFFVHYAADKLGQHGLDDDSGKGLGSGLALRDGWIRLNLLGNDLMFQMGRMYVPFTRNYGTTSTKSLLTTDLNWGQGGYRSSIFYPQNVGRDDSITLWGNLLRDSLQYRFMLGEGEEGSENPDDNPRFAGRLSYNFFDKETKWFNAGTYLGKKRILALGAGIDYQQDLVLNNQKDDYFAWTVDAHFEQPLNNGALTCQTSFIDIQNTVNRINWTQLESGSDGQIYSGKSGYLFNQKVGPGKIQPFVHYSYFNVDEDGKDNSQFYGAGLNYYLKGPANKITLEYSYMDQEEELAKTSDVQNHSLITLQTAFGF